MIRCMSCLFATDRDRDGDRKFKCAYEDKWSGRKLLLHEACIMHQVSYDCTSPNFLCHTYVKSFKGDVFDICRKCLKPTKEVV